MDNPVSIQIIGAPIFTCKDGLHDAWRDVAHWAEGRLKQRFGEAVLVTYHDLFDPAAPALPAGAQLPVVLVGGEVTIAGGKISIPVIRRKVETVLEKVVV